jgi:hypothetical protein
MFTYLISFQLQDIAYQLPDVQEKDLEEIKYTGKFQFLLAL